ncbi:MAG: [protein-PII] uridylyltransferase, partial [Alphaproteobacteria bacterium]
MSKAAKPNIADQRAIVDRRDLAAQLDDIAEKGSIGSAARRAEVLGVFKAALQRGRDEIRRRFEGGAGARATARDTVQAQCFLIDQLIRTLYDFAFEKVYPVANPTSGEKKAIVATGGYGRGELAPQSDIDLLFLIAYKLTPTTEQVIEYILYMLWDLGLKVGHATRSVDECIRMAKADHTIRTGLLESRYLWGDQPLYAELKKRFWDAAESDAMVFVEQKLHERDERHQRLGDSRYLLEPNVKEGKGGLRDLHTLYWIAKFLYKVDDVSELVGKKVFTAEEAQRFHRAQEFLTGVRCHLHYVTGRAEDRLTFDVQPGIGKRMGYKDRAGSRGVERFMKHYFLVAKTVGDLTRIFCASLEAMHQRKPRFRFQLFSRPKQIGAFVLEGGRLNAPNEKVFRDDPVNILRLFHLAQHEELDIHPAALRFITQNIKLVDAGLRENKEANRLFLEMLCSPKDPETTLRRLNEAGVFGRFVPDFGRVVAQMQHDMYHVYTVDEHTVRAI